MRRYGRDAEVGVFSDSASSNGGGEGEEGVGARGVASSRRFCLSRYEKAESLAVTCAWRIIETKI